MFSLNVIMTVPTAIDKEKYLHDNMKCELAELSQKL